jgi:hypothetical protein
MNKPVILTDVDDVKLNWIEGFRSYASRVLGRKITGLPQGWEMAEWLGVAGPKESNQLVHDFNHGSPEFGRLPPLAEAEIYVPYLAKYCDIVAITCCSTDPTTVALRKQNLDYVFGKNTVKDLICQPLGTNKIDNLSIFKDRNVIAWVEDKSEAAIHGHELGYRSFLMKQDHNKAYREANPNGPLTYVSSWREIANVIF